MNCFSLFWVHPLAIQQLTAGTDIDHSSVRMRIVWVKMGGLWPATTGGRVRSLNTISELARGHEVTVITTHGNGDDPTGLKQQLGCCERVVSLPYAVPKRGSAAFAASVTGSWFS